MWVFVLKSYMTQQKSAYAKVRKNSKLRFVISLNTDIKYFYVKQKT